MAEAHPIAAGGGGAAQGRLRPLLGYVWQPPPGEALLMYASAFGWVTRTSTFDRGAMDGIPRVAPGLYRASVSFAGSGVKVKVRRAVDPAREIERLARGVRRKGLKGDSAARHARLCRALADLLRNHVLPDWREK